MKNYLIEHETLAKVIDNLLTQKFPGQPPVELAATREENIKKLDDRIGTAIFGSLNESQLDEINSMFDREESDPTAFRLFFKNAGVDLEAVIAKAISNFSQEFLGGQNV